MVREINSKIGTVVDNVLKKRKKREKRPLALLLSILFILSGGMYCLFPGAEVTFRWYTRLYLNVKDPEVGYVL